MAINSNNISNSINRKQSTLRAAASRVNWMRTFSSGVGLSASSDSWTTRSRGKRLPLYTDISCTHKQTYRQTDTHRHTERQRNRQFDPRIEWPGHGETITTISAVHTGRYINKQTDAKIQTALSSAYLCIPTPTKTLIIMYDFLAPEPYVCPTMH